MLENLLLVARSLDASDIHIAEGYLPLFRVNGKLNNIYGQLEDLAPHKAIVAEPLEKYGLQVDRYKLQQYIALLADEKQLKRLNDTGEVDFAIEDKQKGRYRINIYRDRGEYALAIRLLRKEIPTCSSLNIPKLVEDFAFAKSGLVLVTGPTGSGKSTTLAALLQNLNCKTPVHIITLEDPIEYKFPKGKSMINQREIGNDTLSFASGLRSALREDPDDSSPNMIQFNKRCKGKKPVFKPFSRYWQLCYCC